MASTATDNAGGLKATAINGVKMYAVGAHKWSPAWLAAQTKKASRALRKDAQYQRRIELIQDLTMPTSAGRLAFTADGEHLLVTGTYPPQIRLYELRQLSLKFQRNLVADIVDARVLSDDYSKIALLCADRSVCLHARYGSHYSLRIPRAGRALEYDRASCDLLCAASAPEIFRINLEQGRFLEPLAARSPAVNALARSAVHGLLAAAGADGALECFDLRQRRAVGRIQCADDESVELSAVRFDDSDADGGGGGLRVAVGTGDGRVMIYDLRSSQPLCVKDHMYGSAVARIAWHRSVACPRPRVVSADHRAVRVWDPDSGDSLASIEAPGGAKINDVCVFRDSGLVLMALESSQIPCYFLPALGPAPKWCGYLENLTEELEETAQGAIYDDYKFVTREEVESLNLSNLVGTNLLRAYMHGFFIDYRLYQKAKTIADPFAYDAYRQKRIQEKLESERAARITVKRRLPKVNRDLAARLLKEQEEELQVDEDDMANKKKKKKKNKSGSDLLTDERFRALFTDEAFRVDENSRDYQALHPSQSKKQGSSLIDEHFEPVDDGENDDDDEDEAVSSGESLFSEEGEDEDEDEEPSQKKNNTQAKTKDAKEIERKPKMYVIKDERHAKAFENNMSLADEENLPLEKRIGLEEKRSEKAASYVRGQGGSREISFQSKSVPEGTSGNSFKQKRGIQSLNLKPDRYDFRGRGGRGRGSRGRGAGKRRSFKRH